MPTAARKQIRTQRSISDLNVLFLWLKWEKREVTWSLLYLLKLQEVVRVILNDEHVVLLGQLWKKILLRHNRNKQALQQGAMTLTLYTSCFLSVVIEAPVGFPPLGMVYRTLGAVLLGLCTSKGSHRDRMSFRADGIIPWWSLGTFIKWQPRGWSCGGGSHRQLDLSAWIRAPV